MFLGCSTKLPHAMPLYKSVHDHARHGLGIPKARLVLENAVLVSYVRMVGTPGDFLKFLERKGGEHDRD